MGRKACKARPADTSWERPQLSSGPKSSASAQPSWVVHQLACSCEGGVKSLSLDFKKQSGCFEGFVVDAHLSHAIGSTPHPGCQSQMKVYKDSLL